MGNYVVAFLEIANLTNCEIIETPPISKKTIEIGFKHSPESVCIPFKYNLGNYIEALDLGANVLIQAGGGCRFGFYGEVQGEILKKLGYKFSLFHLSNNYNPFYIVAEFRKYNPKITVYKIARGFYLAYQKARAIEEIEKYIRENIGFEENIGEMERYFKQFLTSLNCGKRNKQILAIKRIFLKKLKTVKVNKPKNPLKVGVLGELYVVMEPFSNFEVEKKLGKMGVEVHRFVSVSEIVNAFLFPRRKTRHLLKLAKPYLKYHIGAHGSETVGLAQKLAKDNFDGLIHLKPFGCMPEINAMPALHRISTDYKIPIIYFSFDSQTSETGINTRLEAFYDMLIMKRKKNE